MARTDRNPDPSLETRLRASQLYNRTIIESCPAAFMVVDGALVITDVNEAMVAKAGCARSELIGNPLERFLSLPPQDAEQVQQTIAAGAALKFEGMLLPRSGERCTIALNVTTFRDPDGLPRGLFTAGP